MLGGTKRVRILDVSTTNRAAGRPSASRKGVCHDRRRCAQGGQGVFLQAGGGLFQADSTRLGCGTNGTCCWPTAPRSVWCPWLRQWLATWPLAPTQARRRENQRCFVNYLRTFDPRTILLTDRYYCSYFLLALAMLGRRDFVVRLHQCRKTDFHNTEQLGDGDHLVKWTRPQRPEWMDQATYEQIPPSISLRLIEVRVQEPGFRNSGDQENDGDGYPALQVAGDGAQRDLDLPAGLQLDSQGDARSCAGKEPRARQLSFATAMQTIAASLATLEADRAVDQASGRGEGRVTARQFAVTARFAPGKPSEEGGVSPTFATLFVELSAGKPPRSDPALTNAREAMPLCAPPALNLPTQAPLLDSPTSP